jgi:hypothetical protein
MRSATNDESGPRGERQKRPEDTAPPNGAEYTQYVSG